VRAQRHEAATPAGLVSLGMCAPCKGCALQRGGRAGCEERALEKHAVTEECAVCVPCCRAARIRSLATSREAVGTLLGFRHTA
jgi:hypothetical protein